MKTKILLLFVALASLALGQATNVPAPIKTPEYTNLILPGTISDSGIIFTHPSKNTAMFNIDQKDPTTISVDDSLAFLSYYRKGDNGPISIVRIETAFEPIVVKQGDKWVIIISKPL